MWGMEEVLQVTFDDGVTIITLDKPIRRSNTGYTGIHLTKNGHYQISLGKDILGWRSSLEEAISLREEACQHKSESTYDEWYAGIRANRKKYRLGH